MTSNTTFESNDEKSILAEWIAPPAVDTSIPALGAGSTFHMLFPVSIVLCLGWPWFAQRWSQLSFPFTTVNKLVGLNKTVTGLTSFSVLPNGTGVFLTPHFYQSFKAVFDHKFTNSSKNRFLTLFESYDGPLPFAKLLFFCNVIAAHVIVSITLLYTQLCNTKNDNWRKSYVSRYRFPFIQCNSTLFQCSDIRN